MQLTEENKAHINAMSIEQLLSRWRFAPIGDPWFQDETGDYWGKRMSELRAQDNDQYVTASKSIGWQKT